MRRIMVAHAVKGARAAAERHPMNASEPGGATATAIARSPQEVRAWLQTRPALGELTAAFPGEWEVVQHELADVAARNDLAELEARIVALGNAPALSRQARRRLGVDGAVAAEVRRQMTVAALRSMCISAATGRSAGRVRFTLLNGWVAQRLLFVRDLERKPVSLLWFRLLWPLLWQRRLLMPLVARKGIYCFYSRRLVRALADRIGDRSCV